MKLSLKLFISNLFSFSKWQLSSFGFKDFACDGILLLATQIKQKQHSLTRAGSKTHSTNFVVFMVHVPCKQWVE